MAEGSKNWGLSPFSQMKNLYKLIKLSKLVEGAIYILLLQNAESAKRNSFYGSLQSFGASHSIRLAINRLILVSNSSQVKSIVSYMKISFNDLEYKLTEKTNSFISNFDP